MIQAAGNRQRSLPGSGAGSAETSGCKCSVVLISEASRSSGGFPMRLRASNGRSEKTPLDDPRTVRPPSSAACPATAARRRAGKGKEERVVQPGAMGPASQKYIDRQADILGLRDMGEIKVMFLKCLRERERERERDSKTERHVWCERESVSNRKNGFDCLHVHKQYKSIYLYTVNDCGHAPRLERFCVCKSVCVGL